MSEVLLVARAFGRARTKGSLKHWCMKDRKHTVRVEEQVADSGLWRKAMARAFRNAQVNTHGRILRYPGPVEVRLVFTLPREESVNGGPIPTHATEWPTAKTVGDADKLERNVLDALSMPERRDQAIKCSGVIVDDSQVVLLSSGKFWVRPDAAPGVDVLVMTAPDPDEAYDREMLLWKQLTGK